MVNNVKETAGGRPLPGAVYHQDAASGKKSASRAQLTQTVTETAAPQRKDQGLFVRGGGAPLTDAMQDYLERLRRDFSGIAVDIRELSGESEIRSYAANRAAGRYLVLAPDFVEWMMSGAQAYDQGKDFISKALDLLGQGNGFGGSQGVVIGENGIVSTWWAPKEEKDVLDALEQAVENIRERMLQAQEEAKKNKPKIVIKKHIGYSSGRDMARLARVSSVRDVRSIISGVYAGIYRLKAAGDQYDGDALRQTVNQMESVVRSARSKIKNLDQEGVAERRIKKATERQEQERALRMRIELAKKRAARRSREHAAIFDKLTSEAVERMCREDEEYRQYLEVMFPSDPLTQAVDAQISGVMPAAAPVQEGDAAAVMVQSVDITV